MSKASVEELETLHGKLAKKLSDALDKLDPTEKGSAAVLNVARQLLRDNRIDADARAGTPLHELADKMTKYPFDPNEENDYGPN